MEFGGSTTRDTMNFPRRELDSALQLFGDRASDIIPKRRHPDTTMAKRSNEKWLSDLRGPGQDLAIEDLGALLMRGLRFALGDRHGLTEEDLEDFVQEAQLKILAGLDSFRGMSRFTTWAQKIAVHLALTELRRRRWRDVSLEDVTGSLGADFVPKILIDRSAGPEQQVIQVQMADTLREVISEELTVKQRRALIATQIHGMPTAEVARRMNTNRNAIYKLVHDARQRIKQRMTDRGLSSEDVLEAFGA